MVKWLLIGWLVAVAAWLTPAACFDEQEVDRIFKEGCDLYEKGEFDQAIQSFESLVAAGVRSSAVYYNLGNSYFKLGHLGKAVVNYRRALVLSPRDEDIRANLDLVRSMVGMRDTTRSIGLGALVEAPTRFLSPEEFQLGFYLTAYLLAICFVWMLFTGGHVRKVMVKIVIIAAIVAVVFLAFERTSQARLNSQSEAVIIARCPLMSGPGNAFERIGELSEGVEVRLRARSGLWLEVELPTGEVGWVRDQAVELI